MEPNDGDSLPEEDGASEEASSSRRHTPQGPAVVVAPARRGHWPKVRRVVRLATTTGGGAASATGNNSDGAVALEKLIRHPFLEAADSRDVAFVDTLIQIQPFRAAHGVKGGRWIALMDLLATQRDPQTDRLVFRDKKELNLKLLKRRFNDYILVMESIKAPGYISWRSPDHEDTPRTIAFLKKMEKLYKLFENHQNGHLTNEIQNNDDANAPGAAAGAKNTMDDDDDAVAEDSAAALNRKRPSGRESPTSQASAVSGVSDAFLRAAGIPTTVEKTTRRTTPTKKAKTSAPVVAVTSSKNEAEEVLAETRAAMMANAELMRMALKQQTEQLLSNSKAEIDLKKIEFEGQLELKKKELEIKAQEMENRNKELALEERRLALERDKFELEKAERMHQMALQNQQVAGQQEQLKALMDTVLLTNSNRAQEKKRTEEIHYNEEDEDDRE